SGGCHSRRCLCCTAIRRPERGGVFSLVETGSDDGRTWSRRNETRAVDHGAPICGIHGRLERTERSAAAYGRNARWFHQHMDNVRALLSLGLSRRSAHRTTARKRTPNHCALRDHCCRCRSGDEPRRMVWDAYSATRKRAVQLVRRYCRDRGFSRNVAMEMEYCVRRPRQRLARISVHAGWSSLKLKALSAEWRCN